MSREVDMGSLKIRLKMDQLDESIKGLQAIETQFDKAADAASGLAVETDKLEVSFANVSSGMAKGAQSLMAVADIVEASSRAIERYGEDLGMTAEQVEKLTGTLENIQQPLLIGAQALMGLSDALAIAEVAHESLKLSMLTNPITLVLIGITAAVAMLYMAWHENWGGIHDTFDRIWTRLQPAFEGISRLLKRIGIDTEDMGKILDIVFGAIGWYIEFMLNPLIDALIILVGWIEKAAEAWDRFWGAQSGGTFANPRGPNMSGGSGGSTYATTYNTETSNLYGGITVVSSETGEAAGMSAFQIYQAQRRGQ